MSVRIFSRLYPESPCGMIRSPSYPSRDRRRKGRSGKELLALNFRAGFWSSSSNANNNNNAWNVNFNNGNVNNNNKTNNNNARCVRLGT